MTSAKDRQRVLDTLSLIERYFAHMKSTEAGITMKIVSLAAAIGVRLRRGETVEQLVQRIREIAGSTSTGDCQTVPGTPFSIKSSDPDPDS